MQINVIDTNAKVCLTLSIFEEINLLKAGSYIQSSQNQCVPRHTVNYRH